MSRKKFVILLVLLLSLALAVPVLAGGWAVVTLDSLPGPDVRAGQELTLGFMVRQHGQTPVHTVDFMNNEPVKPLVTAVNAQTGETVKIEAAPDAAVGHFTARLTLPSAGAWQLSIYPYPLEGELKLELLSVAAASGAAQPAQVEQASAAAPAPANNVAPAQTPAPAGAVDLRPALIAGGLLLLLGAAVAAGVAGSRQPVASTVKAGD